MGLGDFLSGIGDAAVNIGKGAAWVANPTHWDDIAEGAVKAGEFAIENPGQVWDTGFEIGREMLKDQLDPVNLAINAGLLAATVATGGAAAPALIGKIGLGAKSLEAGISAAKIGETVVEGVKTADTVIDTAKAAQTAIKATETAVDVAQGGEKVGRLASFAQDVKGTAEGIRTATGAERAGKVLDAGTELKGAVRETLGLSRYGATTAKRAELAEKVAGEGGGTFRKIVAKKVAGEGNPLAAEGTFNTLDKARRRVHQFENLKDAPESLDKAEEAVQVAADPGKAIEGQVTKAIDERAGKGSGYTDLGQTTESIYTDPTHSIERGGTGQHFWTGPRSQWAGGIGVGYDWRQIDPLRPISPLTVGSRNSSRAQRTSQSAYADTGPTSGPASEAASFSPEMPKSDPFAGATPRTPSATYTEPSKPAGIGIGSLPELSTELGGTRQAGGMHDTVYRQGSRTAGRGPRVDRFPNPDYEPAF